MPYTYTLTANIYYCFFFLFKKKPVWKYNSTGQSHMTKEFWLAVKKQQKKNPQ